MQTSFHTYESAFLFKKIELYTRIHVYTHTHIHVYTYTRIHAYTYTYTYIIYELYLISVNKGKYILNQRYMRIKVVINLRLR